jgi:hypothetical protein
MPKCPDCKTSFVRVHRTAVDKIFYADVYRCRMCGRRLRRLHPFLSVRLGFLSTLHTRCIHCGSLDVRRAAGRDRGESLSRNVLSRLQHLTGAPLNWCGTCRLQYYDWRHPYVRQGIAAPQGRHAS